MVLNIVSYAHQGIYLIYIYIYIYIYLFLVFFDQINASLLNKIINCFGNNGIV